MRDWVHERLPPALAVTAAPATSQLPTQAAQHRPAHTPSANMMLNASHAHRPPATATTGLSATRRRLQSLFDQHKYDIDWSQYEDEFLRFRDWVTATINPGRDGKAYGNDVSKLNFVAQEVLTYLIKHQGFEPEATMERFLAAGTDFDTVFTSYAKYLQTERHASESYIGKQLRDIRHPVKWAHLQEWDWGKAEPEEMKKVLDQLDRLCRQYGTAATQNAKRKQAVAALDTEVTGSELTLEQYREKVFALESQLLVSINTDGKATDEESLAVMECLMLKLQGRGNRGIDSHQIIVADCEEVVKEWAADSNIDSTDVILIKGAASWELLVLNSKGHFIHHALNDMQALLDLYEFCFQGHVGNGDFLFTPSMHGVRPTKAVVTHRFEDSGKYGDYFKSVALQRLGHELRPYGVRRLNAENLQRIDASAEVQNSHSALMGTGVRNLHGCYDQRSQLEKGFLASEVQRS